MVIQGDRQCLLPGRVDHKVVVGKHCKLLESIAAATFYVDVGKLAADVGVMRSRSVPRGTVG
jgi:hypothetical protein